MASSALPSGYDGSDSEPSCQNGVIDTATGSNGSSVFPSQVSNDGPPFTESWCRTSAKVVRFKFTWTIHDFPSRPEKVNEYLESATFPAGSNDELKWRLRAYPKGRKDADDCFSLYLNLVSFSCKGTELPVTYKLRMLNDKCETAVCTSGRKSFVSASKCQTWGKTNFVTLDFLLDEANGLLPGNKLTLVCEGAATVNTVNNFGLSSERGTEFQLTEKFSLFENGEFSDITLSVGGKDILAHKKILAAQSPVFAAMFRCKMEEVKQSRVVITDVRYEVLWEMLRYIYTGLSPNLEPIAEDLLVAANKYDMDELKKMCETVLCSRLTVTNAVDLLILADVHLAKQLKARAIWFITKCAKEVMLTPSWNNLRVNHPSLIIDAFEAMASNSLQ